MSELAIQVAPGIAVLPVRTPTLPPATHTNTYIIGEDRLTVVDPASPYQDQQRLLEAWLDERVRQGAVVERIVLTHHHADHVGGAEALREAFAGQGAPVPVLAHPQTADLLAGRVTVDAPLVEGQVLDCGGRQLEWLHTPGHAPGHVVGVDQHSRAVIAGDMVAGEGTILIDPRDGELGAYLASLQRMKAFGVGTLLPSHGQPLAAGEQVLGLYVAHRHLRTTQIHQALQRHGSQTAAELVPRVYQGLAPEYHRVAAIQITSHLLYMVGHGQAHKRDQSQWEAS